MKRFGRVELSHPDLASLGLTRGEQVLAFGIDADRRRCITATTTHLVVSDVDRPGAETENETDRGNDAGPTQRLRRPWHEVDTGGWDPHSRTLSVSWVDTARSTQWRFDGGEGRLPEVFWERVQATVMLTEPLGLDGPNTSGRVALRRDLSTQQVFVQTVLGRRTDASDPQVKAAVARLEAELAEQAGLD